ncbi:MFS transporter [Actinocrinis puniceicyclus]|uniref:MFS transporter n=1 Tax=Actinocrinis puniceicyclus TaxID=977794 RepID=A0A8J8BE42_9ACTN|nr:MFS transporter [Actinocrinis puniceicyclus]MBS2964821.1 MFS transporter [Actinocrinis puniceicyclus]
MSTDEGQAVQALPGTQDGRRSRGYLALLRNRAFFWLWLGQTVSGLGNGVYSVGLAWVVYSVTGSSADMGLIMAANALPQLLLLFLGGAVADRYTRVVVLRASDLGAAVVTGAMTLVTLAGQPTVPELAACALLLGVTTAFYNPSYSAVSGDMVRRADLPEASALLSVSANTARIAGPAIAGVVYGLGGIRASFGFDALTFLVAVAATTAVMRHLKATRPQAGQLRTATGFASSAWAGLAYLRRTGWLKVLIVIEIVGNGATVPAYLVLLPEVVRSLHGSANELGALSAVQVCASIGCALILGRVRGRFVAGKQLYVFGAAMGLGVLAASAYHENRAFVLIAALLVGSGFAIEVPENTLLQTLVPREIISRVYSIAIALSYAFLPIGLAGAGLAARSLGPGPVLAGGAVLLLGALVLLALSRPGRAVLTLSAASGAEPAPGGASESES